MNKILQSNFRWPFILIGLLVVNYLAAIFHTRFDLTKEKRYTLSQPTKELVQQLDSVIIIDVFLKGDFPSGFKKLANSTEEFLRVLKDQNPTQVQYNFISPEDGIPGTRSRYGDTLVAMGANPINLTVQIEAGQQNKLVFPVAMVTYKGEQQLVDLFNSRSVQISQAETNSAEARMEYNFLKTLNDLVNAGKPMIAYSVGNGELTDARTYDLQQVLQKDYSLYTIDLFTEPFIPDTFKTLMIVKPSFRFTDEEKLKIDQFVMRGGNLLFFIDALYAEQDSLRFKTETIAYDRDLNLTDLLFRYGVRINPDLIMDLQCDFMPFAVGGSPENPQYEFLRWNYYPVFVSNNTHLINKNIGPVAGRFVNSIDTVQAAGIDKTVLLSSSANSRTITTPALISLNENRNTPEDALFNKANIPAAVLLEGSFKSLYRSRAGKSIIDSLALMGVPFRDSSLPAKMIIAGDADLVLNDVSTKDGPLPMGINLFNIGSQYEYQFANREFLMNSLEFLTNKPEIIAVRNKDMVLRLLDGEKVKSQRTLWQFLNIGLPVLLVILIGWIYQQLRRRQYTA